VKKINLIAMLICLLLTISCSSNHESKGTAYFGGVEIVFDFDNEKITLNNYNNTVVKVNIQNLSNGSVLAADLITWPGSADNKENLIFHQNDLVEIKVWQGYTSVFYGDFFGREADFVGQATLTEDTIIVYPTTNFVSYSISLPVTNGANCELAGQYNPSDSLDQRSNSLYCQNISSDLIAVQLYMLKPALPSGYEADFELAAFLVYWEDAKAIDLSYDQPEALALKVSSFNALNNSFVKVETFGFLLDISTKTYSQITSPIILP
jgi:hypothetical protein